MGEGFVHLENINMSYGSDVVTQVLFDLSLDVAKGEFLALIGPSGSGKSTLLNIIGTLDRPTSGILSINNTVLQDMAEKKLAGFRNRTMGFIFQFHYLFTEFTVLENVLIPKMLAKGTYSPEDRDKAEFLLEKTGLKELAKKPAGQISGGQQQRVAISRALINEPPLILADEPTGNLDTASSDRVMELLREINRNMQTTFIIVTHDRSIAAKADRIVELVDGKIYRDYIPEELGHSRTWKELEPHACRDCFSCNCPEDS